MGNESGVAAAPYPVNDVVTLTGSQTLTNKSISSGQITGLGTFATQNYATPPAIGGTTPAAGSFTTLSATGNFTTNITGLTQCIHVNSAGLTSGTGVDCGSGGSAFQANGTPLSSSTTINFESGAGIIVSNPSAGNVQYTVTNSSRLVTGATDTILSTDLAGTVAYNSSSAVAVSLPAANASGFGAGATVYLININTGTATVTPAASIDGHSTIAITGSSGCTFWEDATPTWHIDYAGCPALTSGGASGANPTGTVGLSTVNGSATTFLRSDGAPPLSQGIVPTWTGIHTFSATPVFNAGTTTNGTAAIVPAAGGLAESITGGSITSGTTGFGRSITGTVNTATNIDGIIDFANVTCTSCSGTSLLVDWQVGGGTVFKVDKNGSITTSAGNLFANQLTSGNNVSVGAGSQFNWNTNGILTSPAAGKIQVGAANAAAPVNQTVLAQGSRGGTDSNVGGGTLTIQSGDGTGTGTPATMIFQTPHLAASGTTQQTLNTQLTLGDNVITIASGSTVSINSLLISTAAPTISSGFGTGPSVTHNNGSASFSINVGTGGTATSGVVALNATAADGWSCSASDPGATPTGQTEVSSASTTTVTLTNYSRTVGTALAWTASEIIQVSCFAN